MTARRRRKGFTLLEILLVMAILVVAMGLLVPSLNAMYGVYKVQGAVDSVRGAWALARAYAIEQGRPYRFSFEPDGSFFRIAPDRDEYWNGSVPSDDPEGKGFVMEKALPGGVKFILNGDPAPVPAGSPTKDQEKPSGKWDTACVFLCDGTAREDVRIVFTVRSARPIDLRLRGLTGATTVATLPTP